MLETVKQKILEPPTKTFNEIFVSYMMDVQDRNIEEEFRFLRSNNNLTPLSVATLLKIQSERLVPNGRGSRIKK